jgi:hypothetical protein
MRNMKNQLLKRRLYILWFIFVTTLILSFVTKPLLICIFHNFQEIIEMQRQIKSAKEWIMITSKYKTENEKLQQLINVRQNTINKQNGIFETIKYIQLLTHETNVEIVSIEPAIQTNNGENNCINFTFQGSYHNLGKVINAIETGPFLIFIRNLNIEKNEKKKMLTALLFLEIHYERDLK